MTDDLEARALKAALEANNRGSIRREPRMRAAIAAYQRVMREAEPGAEVEIDYTNWHGERAVRTIRPTGRLIQGPTEHHRDAPWLVEATDVAKGEIRTFDPANIHRWGDQCVMREGTWNDSVIEALIAEKYPGYNIKADEYHGKNYIQVRVMQEDRSTGDLLLRLRDRLIEIGWTPPNEEACNDR